MLNVRGCCAAAALLIHFVEYWFVYGEPPAGPERAKNRKLRLARILLQREKKQKGTICPGWRAWTVLERVFPSLFEQEADGCFRQSSG